VYFKIRNIQVHCYFIIKVFGDSHKSGLECVKTKPIPSF
jgi:hypothetical protein